MTCLVGSYDELQGDGDGNCHSSHDDGQGDPDGDAQACSAAAVAPILLRSASALGGDMKREADSVLTLLLQLQAEMR